jgi:hypothetical protein
MGEHAGSDGGLGRSLTAAVGRPPIAVCLEPVRWALVYMLSK